MLSTYTYPKFAYRCPTEIGQRISRRIVVVGAGPVGLAMAIDLAQQGLDVLLLDDDNTVSLGSRGLCYAKRALEVLDRIGAGQMVVDKGVSWNVGRTFNGNEEVYSFNLLPEPDHERPGMINLQQYYLEEFLLKRAGELPHLEIRWQNKVTAVEARDDGSTITVETADGNYTVDVDWLIVGDGARSGIRRLLGLDIEGKVFQDRFLIADVVMKADFPAERWFWFDPPFHPNQSVLLHREADNVWRIDFQLGWDVDPEEEKKPEKVISRIKAMLGEQHAFDLEWVSVYTFQCRRMKDFRHRRVFFVGDAAHQVSPFGARGANSGLQDTDNLAWKLKLVIEGQAPDRLLESYNEERAYAADENIMNSTRSTDFITPKSAVSKMFRNAVLDLARQHRFARALVNSGRLSVPSFLYSSSLNTADQESFSGKMIPGAPMDDAPVTVQGKSGWLLRQVGDRFTVLIYADQTALATDMLAQISAVKVNGIPVAPIVIAANAVVAKACEGNVKVLVDVNGRFRERYDAKHGTAYLIRPDQHVAARWRNLDATALRAALARATCN
ncbi:MAG: FAD-dependent oxidoreductase [Burkholderiaceae bacterium]|nr:FAD-dependent oxidoreductase [Burkholderiaceae bacterium]